MVALKRGFLIGMLVLIGLAAVVCVGMFVMGSGRTNQQLAITTGAIWGYCIVLAFGAFYTVDRGAPLLKIMGMAALAAIALCVVAMPIYFWWEYNWYTWYGSGRGPTNAEYEFRQRMEQLSGTAIAVATWLTLTPCVLTPRMTWGRVFQWLTAIFLIVGLVAILNGLWSRRSTPDSDKVIAVSLLLGGAGALAVLVINRFLGIKVPDILTSVTQSIWLRCPRCLQEQEVAAGESRCTGCKLLFKLEVEEPRCGKCGYNLHALTRPICPECGAALRSDEVTGDAVQGLPPERPERLD